MTQNTTQVVITNDENEIAERLVNRLVYRADSFGVTIDEYVMEGLQIFFAERLDETSEELMEGLQNFFAEVIQGGRGADAYNEDVIPATLPVVDRTAAALQRFAEDLEGSYF